ARADGRIRRLRAALDRRRVVACRSSRRRLLSSRRRRLGATLVAWRRTKPARQSCEPGWCDWRVLEPAAGAHERGGASADCDECTNHHHGFWTKWADVNRLGAIGVGLSVADRSE